MRRKGIHYLEIALVSDVLHEISINLTHRKHNSDAIKIVPVFPCLIIQNGTIHEFYTNMNKVSSIISYKIRCWFVLKWYFDDTPQLKVGIDIK